MRTTIDLSHEQVTALHQLGEHMHLSRAELLRRAVAEYLEKRHMQSTEQAFGLWRQRQVDSLAYENNLRGEWTA